VPLAPKGGEEKAQSLKLVKPKLSSKQIVQECDARMTKREQMLVNKKM